MNYIHHIVLTVSDPMKSSDFYRDALDWSISEQKEDHVCLAPKDSQYPECEFMLILGKARDRVLDNNDFDRNRIGLDHFAFQVDSMEELEKIRDRLMASNIAMEDGGITDDDFGGTGIFCTDPDGMKVEFHLNSVTSDIAS